MRDEEIVVARHETRIAERTQNPRTLIPTIALRAKSIPVDVGESEPELSFEVLRQIGKLQGKGSVHDEARRGTRRTGFGRAVCTVFRAAFTVSCFFFSIRTVACSVATSRETLVSLRILRTASSSCFLSPRRRAAAKRARSAVSSSSTPARLRSPTARAIALSRTEVFYKRDGKRLCQRRRGIVVAEEG